MYAQHFGLTQEPFSIAPDPRFLFMSERHREALAHLLYGVRGAGGFVLLTGEIGAGKTTVCRCFLEQIPRRCNVAYIFNPKLTATELLKSVCDEFRIPYVHEGPGTATVKDYIDPLNEFLLRTHAVGQNNVLIIDEAQNLAPEVLEQLRLLTNLETSERKLLQIILIGQPELRDLVARPEMEQLAQRVIARFHLGALSEAETTQYVGHRLGVAGLKTALPFDRAALRRIHQLTGGVPRRINLLCDRALLGAYASGVASVSPVIVEQAAREVFDRPSGAAAAPHRTRPLMWALGGLAAAGVLVALGWSAAGWSARTGTATEAAAQAVAPTSADASMPKAAAVREAPAPKADLASDAGAPPPGPLRFESLWGSEADAWRALAQAWGLTLGEGTPCELTAREDVHCFRSRSNLAEIRQLGRPGVLTLHDAQGREAHALLAGLDEGAALLHGPTTQRVSIDALAQAWRGDFGTLWRAPPGYRTDAPDGRSGPMVDWLAVQFAALDGVAPPTGRPVFDAALKARVHRFQAAQGLTPDGVPGPKTVMQLNRVAGVDEPRLGPARN